MLLFGEIIESYPPNDERNLSKTRTEYTVRSFTESSMPTTYLNCVVMQMVGGVDNFEEIVVQTSSNDSQSLYLDDNPLGAGVKNEVNYNDKVKRVGAKCILAFINSPNSTPVIIGFLPFEIYSENGETVFENSANNEDQILNRPINVDRMGPMWRMRMNGINLHIDELGQYRIQHTGLPKISLKDGYYESTKWGEGLGKDVEDPLILTTTLDFLQNGEFRVVDGEQQGFVIDPKNQFISINNTIEIPNYEYDPLEEVLIYEPQDPSLPPLGEEIRLDKLNQTLTLRSSKNFIKLVGEDAREIIFGNEEKTIQKNKTETIVQDSFTKIGKNSVVNITENYSVSVGKTFALVSTQGTQTFLMDATKDKETIFLAHKSGAQLVMDKDGSVKVTSKDGSFLFLDATTGAATILTKSGDVISANKGVTITDSEGTEIIKMKGGKIEISAKQDVVLSATNVSLNAGSISLGAGASFSATIAEKIMMAFNQHIHPTPTGPSGPPLVPLIANGTPAPNDIASSSLKLKS